MWVQQWPLFAFALIMACAVVWIAFWYPRNAARERCGENGHPMRSSWQGRCTFCGHRMPYMHRGQLVQPVPTRALPVAYWPVELIQRRRARRAGK